MVSVKRILLRSLVAAGLLLIPVAAAPFALAGNPCYHGFDVPEVTVGPGSDVKLMPCAFDPTITVIQPGETVTFRNSELDVHLVTGANAEWGDRDIQIKPNQSVAYTFEKPGVYPYACTLHPGMSGAIVVGDGGPALAAAFAAATAGGDGGSTPQGGAPTEGGPSAAATPAPSSGADPLLLAAVAGLIGAALALVVVAIASRARTARAATRAAGDERGAQPGGSRSPVERW